MRTCKIVPADHREKIKRKWKEGWIPRFYEGIEKKLWNMKVTIIPIIIGALGTVTKGLIKGLKDLEMRGRVETIQTSTLLRSARILRRVLETCRHSNTSEWPSTNADVKNSQGVNNNNNNNNKLWNMRVTVILVENWCVQKNPQKDWKIQKSEDERKPYRWQHY